MNNQPIGFNRVPEEAMNSLHHLIQRAFTVNPGDVEADLAEKTAYLAGHPDCMTMVVTDDGRKNAVFANLELGVICRFAEEPTLTGDFADTEAILTLLADPAVRTVLQYHNAILPEDPPYSPARAAEACALPLPQTQAILERLEQAGLVSRSAQPAQNPLYERGLHDSERMIKVYALLSIARMLSHREFHYHGYRG